MLQTFIYLVVLGVAQLAAPATALRGCWDLHGNSCWHAINDTRQNVSIRCDGYGHDKLFIKNNLTPQSIHSQQYDRGWGDGLGYPPGGTAFDCRIDYREGGCAALSFATLGWGDRVQIRVMNENVAVTVSEFWSDQRMKIFEAIKVSSCDAGS